MAAKTSPVHTFTIVCITCAPLSLAGACASDQLHRSTGTVELCADIAGKECSAPLLLGAYRVGETHTLRLGLANRGSGLLRVTTVAVDSADLSLMAHPRTVEPTVVMPVELSLAPSEGVVKGSVRVESNDLEHPILEVPFRYQGVAPVLVACAAAGLSATPAFCSEHLVVDLGEVRPTQAADALVHVRNSGTAMVQISGADITDGSSSPHREEFRTLTPTGPGKLEPGEEGQLVVRYQPADGLADRYTVVIVPSDDTPPVTVTLAGTTPPNDPPVAQAVEVVSGTTRAQTQTGLPVWFDGRGSADPEGDPLAFFWSVVAAPTGSTAKPEHPNSQTTRFLPDLPGAYAIQLQVADALNLRDVVDLQLEVAPRVELLVSAEWSTGGDVDLHLLPAGDPLFGATDCYFAQTSVDWGQLGVAADDPELVADREEAPALEIIRVPQPSPGTYEVVLQAFDLAAGPATVAVTVARDDGTTQLVNQSFTLTHTCDVVRVGTLSWPDGTFAPGPGGDQPVCYVAP